MNSTRMLVVLASVVVAVAACDETVIPPPPDPPPQIKTIQSYTKTSDNKGLPSNDVYAFLAVSNGQFWIGTAAGVVIYPSLTAKTRTEVVTEITGLPHPRVTSMVEHNGKVYVGTWGGGLGVYDVAADSWSQIRVSANGLLDPFISEVAVSPTEDKLYFATNDGVTIYAPATNAFTHFLTDEDPLVTNDLLDPIVSAVEVTEDAGVVQRWYGPRVDVKLVGDEFELHGITVQKSASTVYQYKTTNSGLEEPNVNDITYDPVSDLYWICYSTRGMSAVDVTAKTWVDYSIVEGLPSNTVSSITRAHGTLWVATQGGLAKLTGGRWQGYARSAGLQADRARRVYSDDGERLWVAFVEGGAARVDPASAENP